MSVFEVDETIDLEVLVDERARLVSVRVGVETAMSLDLARACEDLGLRTAECAQLVLVVHQQAWERQAQILETLPGTALTAVRQV